MLSLKAELERERATVVVAEKAQQPVGLLVVWTIPPDELHVLELAVLPSHRRQGVAKQMLAWAFHKHRFVFHILSWCNHCNRLSGFMKQGFYSESSIISRPSNTVAIVRYH